MVITCVESLCKVNDLGFYQMLALSLGLEVVRLASLLGSRKSEIPSSQRGLYT